MFDFYTVRELYEIVNNANSIAIDQIEYIELEGWVRTNRFNGHIGFIELNDGTYFKNVQIVYNDKLNTKEIEKYLTGTCIKVLGKFILTPNNKQAFEIEATKIELIGSCDPSYPLQKKRHSFEYLREIPQLRLRTNTFSALFRLRSVLSMAIHEFFQDQGFIYLHSPIITSNDGEGAGNIFSVATKLDDGKLSDNDFFNKTSFLAPTGQLHAEAFALAFRDVYTFGPTFRAEKSNTKTHAAEFWMVEPEIAFADLEDNMNLIEDCVKYCIRYCMLNANEEMKFFNDFIDKDLFNRLNNVLEKDFAKMTYSDAIEHLLKADVKFENKVSWGIDLASEHERYLCEKVVKGPVFITDYPKDFKAFYMRQNDDGKTVAACDLLVPVVGELVGGSQREERIDKLESRIKELGMDLKNYEWYLDLRRYGGCKHAGFGIGFERFLMYLSGMQNIRDVIPFARNYKNIIF